MKSLVPQKDLAAVFLCACFFLHTWLETGLLHWKTMCHGPHFISKQGGSFSLQWFPVPGRLEFETFLSWT